MKNRDIRRSTTWRVYGFSTLAFLLTLSAAYLYIDVEDTAWHREKLYNDSEMAVIQASSIERRIELALSAARILGNEVKLHHGKLIDFEPQAANLIASLGGITNLQLAPDGVIQQIYPLAGHEKALGHNILQDDRRRSTALTAIETRQLTVAGPFELVQGGQAVIGRYPVFLDDTDGTEHFWGFTSVLIALNDLISATDLPMLAEKGYSYQISHLNPDSRKKEVFSRSGHTIPDPAISFDIQLPNKVWTLTLSGEHQQVHSPNYPWHLSLALLASSLVAFLVWVLLKQPARLKTLVQDRTLELEQSTAELKAERSFLSSLLDSIPDLVFYKDTEGAYLGCNRAMEAAIGISRNSLVGLKDVDVLADEQPLNQNEERKVYNALDALKNEAWVTFQCGSPVLLETIKTPFLRPDGTVAGLIGISRDVTARKQAEEVLQSIQKRLKFLLTVTPAVIYTCPSLVDNRTTFISDNVRAQLDYPPQAFTEDPEFWINHIHPQDKPHVLSELKAIFDHDVHHIEYRFQHNNGSYRWLRDELSLVRENNGSPQEVVGCRIDITSTKNSDAILLQSEKRYRQLFDANQAVMLLIDPVDGSILNANQTACLFYGYNLDQIKALKIGDINTLTADEVQAEIQKAQQQERNYFEFSHRLANGDIRAVEVYSGPVTVDGQQILYSVIHDVSRRVKAEELSRMLSHAVEQSPAAVMITDPREVIEYVNPKFEQITGYSKEMLIGQTPRVLKSGLTAPEIYADLWNTILAGEVWYGELQNKKRCGELYWEEVSVSPIHAKDGTISHFVSTRENINERKLLEEHSRLAAAVFDNTVEAIMVTDAQGSIVAVNQAFSEITGYSSEDVLGQSPHVLNSGRHTKAFFDQMWQTLAQTGQWQGEIWNRRKNGEVYPEWLSITSVVDSNMQVMKYVGLFTDITRRKQSEQKIWSQANYDALTQLPNRNLFQDRLAQAITHAERAGTRVALMFIDLDHFKWVNDTLGHEAGDKLLQEAAVRLKNCVRKEDTIARIGGDEFTVILQDIQQNNDVDVIALKLLTSLLEPFQLADQEAFVSGSIGITLFPDDGINVESLLKNADTAMYQAKDAGRSRHRFFTQEMHQQALDRVSLERELRLALEHEQFQIYFQPIIDLDSAEVSAETLLRWNHPEKGLVGPDNFIPLAEETGLILPIGDWVLRQSCEQAQIWRAQGIEFSHVSVNVSGVQLREVGCVDKLTEVLATTGLPPEMLVLEITESTLIQSGKDMTDKLNAIRALKVRLSLDDFGTGYSSLSFLKRFPIDFLKIDRSFVRDVTSCSEDAALTEAIIVMAHRLGLKVVGEGVETEAQLEFLRSKSCNFTQGFLYSQALTGEDFERWLLKRLVMA